jgi:hypothetical protein
MQQFGLVLVIGIDELLGHLEAGSDVVERRAFITLFVKKSSRSVYNPLPLKRNHFPFECRTLRWQARWSLQLPVINADGICRLK